MKGDDPVEMLTTAFFKWLAMYSKWLAMSKHIFDEYYLNDVISLGWCLSPIINQMKWSVLTCLYNQIYVLTHIWQLESQIFHNVISICRKDGGKQYSTNH